MTLDHYELGPSEQKEMNFCMRLSFFVGVFMLLCKSYAYIITRSTAILSDAAESVIHVLAVGFAAYSMWLSLKPADIDHQYGHEKVVFFSAGLEGATIILAAFFIYYESIPKLIFGGEIENIGIGAFLIIAAILINLILSLYLMRKGKKHRSLILEANGKHILTDCWTSFGAIIALGLVKITGIALFDPLIAILAATNILWTGSKLIRRSVSGLMDEIDPVLHEKIVNNLQRETSRNHLEFHHLRERPLGHKVLIEFHLIFPRDLMLAKAHEMASQIEHTLKSSLDMEAEILTHLEVKKYHDEIHKKYGLPI